MCIRRRSGSAGHGRLELRAGDGADGLSVQDVNSSRSHTLAGSSGISANGGATRRAPEPAAHPPTLRPSHSRAARYVHRNAKRIPSAGERSALADRILEYYDISPDTPTVSMPFVPRGALAPERFDDMRKMTPPNPCSAASRPRMAPSSEAQGTSQAPRVVARITLDASVEPLRQRERHDPRHGQRHRAAPARRASFDDFERAAVRRMGPDRRRDGLTRSFIFAAAASGADPDPCARIVSQGSSGAERLP